MLLVLVCDDLNMVFVVSLFYIASVPKYSNAYSSNAISDIAMFRVSAGGDSAMI
jgi:hypothetical protein